MDRHELFASDRLSFRHLCLQDLDVLARIYADPEVRRYFPDGTLDRAQTREEIEWFQNGHPRHPELGLWATVLKSSGELIGRCGLLPWALDGRQETEVAFLIDKPYWGNGLGTEAARAVYRHATETLGIRRLVCLIEEGNAASIKVAESLGMRFERKGEDEHGPFLLYSVEP